MKKIKIEATMAARLTSQGNWTERRKRKKSGKKTDETCTSHMEKA
jgi:hypothetical protein